MKDEKAATKQRSKGRGNDMCSTHKKYTNKISKFPVAGTWANTGWVSAVDTGKLSLESRSLWWNDWSKEGLETRKLVRTRRGGRDNGMISASVLWMERYEYLQHILRK